MKRMGERGAVGRLDVGQEGDGLGAEGGEVEGAVENGLGSEGCQGVDVGFGIEAVGLFVVNK